MRKATGRTLREDSTGADKTAPTVGFAAEIQEIGVNTMPRSVLGEPIVLLSGALCVFGAALLAVGGQQAADNDARALVVKALERVTWNEEQDFEARYPA